MTHLRHGDILVRTARRSDAAQLAAWWNEGAFIVGSCFAVCTEYALKWCKKQRKP